MALILLPGPIAVNGEKEPIPLLQDSAIPNRMSYDQGIPAICSEDPNEGGLPPRRADKNWVNYMLSNNFFELQQGKLYTFDAFMTQSPRTGYPKGALLWDYANNQFLISTKDNNIDNFVTTPSFIGTSWVPAFNLYVSAGPVNISGTVQLQPNINYSNRTLSGDTVFQLPTFDTPPTTLRQIQVELITGATLYTVDFGTTHYFGYTAPLLQANSAYDVFYEYSTRYNDWVVGILKKQ
ncbi:MAG: hypothetical protein ACI37O_01550 [Candidatus Avelusimicrobium sp.]|uniref:hypothetical protein n=1 Tax=Candidatus Avelusimicrobium sp. TaxID=3048833 RepID=UPI003F0CDCE7